MNNSFAFQNVSCYGLLSKEPILDPKPTDKKITLPFYPGCRYAALPGTSNHNDASLVNTFPSRPEHLVYHDHSFHLGDIKVHYIDINVYIICLLFSIWKRSSLTHLVIYFLGNLKDRKIFSLAQLVKYSQ